MKALLIRRDGFTGWNDVPCWRREVPDEWRGRTEFLPGFGFVPLILMVVETPSKTEIVTRLAPRPPEWRRRDFSLLHVAQGPDFLLYVEVLR